MLETLKCLQRFVAKIWQFEMRTSLLRRFEIWDDDDKNCSRVHILLFLSISMSSFFCRKGWDEEVIMASPYITTHFLAMTDTVSSSSVERKKELWHNFLPVQQQHEFFWKERKRFMALEKNRLTVLIDFPIDLPIDLLISAWFWAKCYLSRCPFNAKNCSIGWC